MSQPLVLHPDRALSVDPEVRGIARRLYRKTAELPLVCMHGHVEAADLADDRPFDDPAQLLVVPDHYVTRMLVSQGVPPEQLGVPRVDGGPAETDSRQIWQRFCSHWHLFRGTPSRYWLEHELVEVFGVTERPSAESADRIYDQIAATIARPEFRRLALLDRFRIEVLATTDAATSDLAHHTRLAAAGHAGRVVPTFRIFSMEKAREFYLDFLGCKVDWEHRFTAEAPVYMRVSREGRWPWFASTGYGTVTITAGEAEITCTAGSFDLEVVVD